jgi:hypothetical protein
MSYQARRALTAFSTAMTTFCRMEQSLIESLPYSSYQAILSQRVLNQNVEETGTSIASYCGAIPKDQFIKTLKRVSIWL